VRNWPIHSSPPKKYTRKTFAKLGYVKNGLKKRGRKYGSSSPEKVNAHFTIIEIEIIGQVRGVRDPKSSFYNS
jgi:hypothetical protein